MFAAVRKQWKKIAGVGAVYCAADYTSSRYRRWQRKIQRQQEAALYGDQPLSPDAPLQKMTVVLDLRSANSAAKGVFNVEVAPLLHLAGVAVDVVEARERGQTKDIARHLQTNGVSGVVVVGDDGTMQEFVTGWLRREDKDQVTQECPLGLIPLGFHNAFDSLLRGERAGDEDADRVGRAVLGVVRGVTKNVDTVTVRSLATGQEVSAIGYLGWGLPGIVQSRTFNEYVRRSRWWGQAKILKDVILNGGTPKYRARVERARSGVWSDEGEVEFSAFYAAKAPICRSYRIAPNQGPDSGLVSLVRIGPLSPMQFIRAYWSLGNGLGGNDVIDAVIDARNDQSPASDGSNHQSEEGFALADEFRFTPLTNHAAVAPGGSQSESGDISESAAGDDEIPLTIDGEVLESFPVHVKVNRQQLRVFL